MKTTISNSIKVSALAMVFIVSSGAQADQYEVNKRYLVSAQSNCVEEYITQLSETENLVKACFLKQPLRLVWATQSYPNMNQNPRQVQYWQGSYSKTFAVHTKYLRELINVCSGQLIKQHTFVVAKRKEVTYPVINPNLDSSISESYMLVPMTEAEAQQELVEAKNRCLQN